MSTWRPPSYTAIRGLWSTQSQVCVLLCVLPHSGARLSIYFLKLSETFLATNIWALSSQLNSVDVFLSFGFILENCHHFTEFYWELMWSLIISSSPSLGKHVFESLDTSWIWSYPLRPTGTETVSFLQCVAWGRSIFRSYIPSSSWWFCSSLH